MDTEQDSWFARPAAERGRYLSEYVAIHGGEVVDRDPVQRTLYLRIRARFGHQPVLIVKADWKTIPNVMVH